MGIEVALRLVISHWPGNIIRSSGMIGTEVVADTIWLPSFDAMMAISILLSFVDVLLLEGFVNVYDPVADTDVYRLVYEPELAISITRAQLLTLQLTGTLSVPILVLTGTVRELMVHCAVDVVAGPLTNRYPYRGDHGSVAGPCDQVLPLVVDHSLFCPLLVLFPSQILPFATTASVALLKILS